MLNPARSIQPKASTQNIQTRDGMSGIKDRMGLRNAQPHDLVFPNSEGKPDGHFLRKLKAIAKKAGGEDAELHRFRKTYADTLHEEGVSLNTIRIRLGHESGKDAESEEAQEHPVKRVDFVQSLLVMVNSGAGSRIPMFA